MDSQISERTEHLQHIYKEFVAKVLERKCIIVKIVCTVPSPVLFLCAPQIELFGAASFTVNTIEPKKSIISASICAYANVAVCCSPPEIRADVPLLLFRVNSSERAGKSRNPHRVLSNNGNV